MTSTTLNPPLQATAGDTGTARAPRAGKRKKALNFIAVHTVAIAVALLFILPFVFVFLTSVMSDSQAMSGDLWPSSWHWDNYSKVFHTDGFLTWWKNSIIYAVAGTFFTVCSSVPVAYALAKFRFRGRKTAMIMVISTMMLPPQVIVIPMYLVWAQQFHLSGSLWPLIIPMAFGDAYSIFLLRQFLLTIPKEYMESARVDGCGEFKTLVKVIVPMAKPGIAAVALFQFFYCWNDYFGPQIYAAQNPGAWTLSYGLESFKSAHAVNWNMTMAATLLIMAPVVIVFFFAQKAFVEGVTLTGVKG
ncbi:MULTISPECIES: carbohydrate ABC transporter permease [unclassified Streptomyces]|uniref:Carbohydrate ABC transporter permease n=1 Tax=Streptomyces evansiae TaxID=3075535 RepID=A0ABD5E6Y7_9ACTN|nr:MULTISPECIES: carbohydrate ABC transporter permease [unclassified Streptomyces]ASY34926.1 sugar ABC transporter permease [Streptomyces sp. CLI2509]EFK99823.1 sugar transport membrane protein [Streptomyces sp. SPB78]EGJ77348.1 putative sugar ABC transporter permease protein [Streptomyces sp. Tu6071]MDT0409003.1 carbohydrate ABC transporter permease [Streptomyces sp. DSM 41979]MDT0417144.1 carbohydrate ABC transporter permease [Streptomyces sp. DSM 41982]